MYRPLQDPRSRHSPCLPSPKAPVPDCPAPRSFWLGRLATQGWPGSVQPRDAPQCLARFPQRRGGL